jgi:hypothetical protein
MKNTAGILVVVLALLAYLIFHNHESITGQKIKLGTPGYDSKLISAPKTNSFILKLISEFLQTRFAPAIIRLIVNDNGVVDLRELASQIQEPPLHEPLRRLSIAERAEYDSQISVLENDLNVENEPSSADILPTVHDYYSAYRTGILPSEILKETLKTIRDWEKQGFRIFTEVIDEQVMAQAYESDKRHREGKTFGPLDGVPIAVKDTLSVTGHRVYNGLNPSENLSSFWYIAEEDDPIVQRFREAGAIVLGLTIMSEGGVVRNC